MTEPAEVLIAEPVSTAEAAQIAAEFSSIGLTADLRYVAIRHWWSRLMQRRGSQKSRLFMKGESPNAYKCSSWVVVAGEAEA